MMIIRKAHKGFTMIEIITVIVIIGIIGSMSARLLYQGSEMYVGETKRQGFVSESRAAFWRLLRETQGQKSNEDFIQSNVSKVNIKNAKNDSVTFEMLSNNNFNISLDGGNTSNALSNSLSFSSSNGFSFFDKSYNTIIPDVDGLSALQCEAIRLKKIDFTFIKAKDTLFLSSHIYPINFRFGKKMSYHN